MKRYRYFNLMLECMNLTFQKTELEKLKNSCHNLNSKMSEKHKKLKQKGYFLKIFIKKLFFG